MQFVVDSDLAEDVSYVASQMQWFLSHPMGPNYLAGSVFPDRLREAIIQRRRSVTRDEIATEVAAYRDRRPMQNLGAMALRIQAATSVFSGFLGRISLPKPATVYVHLTWFGPGGSYSTDGSNWIYVRPDGQLGPIPPGPPPHDVLLQEVIHETTHLVLEEPVVKAWRLPPGEEQLKKEGLLDQICACDDLASVIPTYYWQNVTPPANWLELVPWTAGKEPLSAEAGVRWRGR